MALSVSIVYRDGIRCRPHNWDSMLNRLDTLTAWQQSESILIREMFNRRRQGFILTFGQRTHGKAKKTWKRILDPVVDCNSNSDEGMERYVLLVSLVL